MSSASSFVSGPRTPPLFEEPLGELVHRQAARYGDHPAATFSWQRHTLSYNDLASRSEAIAKSMLARGLRHGDNIAIMAGNCYQYLETFIAAARIGCPFVVLNNTYTPKELVSALSVTCKFPYFRLHESRLIRITACKLLFIAAKIRLKDLSTHIEAVAKDLSSLPCVSLAADDNATHKSLGLCTYSSFVSEGRNIDQATLKRAESRVRCEDVVNLQFTSGTTGAPKAAMLTHRNLINNGRYIGMIMHLNSSDIICCPPPLFHCFGLVIGFLSSFTHGSRIVFPCDQFDADSVLDALEEEKCTALLGVPTMFIAEIEANKAKKYKISSVKTGLVAGASVPPALVKQLDQEFGIKGMLIPYGMTETSPVTFMTSFDDTEEKRTKTVGRVLPHTMAKIVDRAGNIVPRGVRGELCVSGYSVQKGYYKNPAKTDEAMKRDENGILWMYTGDECVIDEDGYCSVTGRIKDIIIRGGENIFPVEIENCLAEHPSIAEASCVAIKDARYGEVVGAFLRAQARPGCLDLDLKDEGNRTRLMRPSWNEVNNWVRKSLGSHKAPRYVFWIGDDGVGNEFPKTGSGKIMKHILRDVGERLVQMGRGTEEKGGAVRARL
ncbi:uncharacterized protein Z520_06452 [Fonsecaea multimorphosa CBS 102226]|uniref:AMP-dependent synthetase/ligase domain-containing protein n=1 Tax=Fonsecaea multimorphosa CBS 102226 TaxID=1442371 RepID=A0A0D2K3D9_9EURO|nr:uncharacterized protein Z520_06452 [Fonsecaea multimorphosa CBS 102226]KIX97674.1 hypothetical protein Z520_06452 [Fonsecaea multimorphosa CBS 102226]